ncbi:hypothetical protein DM867_07280 [Halosegnis rubeus]|jgi:NADH-quinone oxidoreductase subunit J|uniref:Uncharacterized protein n=1 Tax=Halosegnis rubeus TaxID=2212850 RepID=A0A5N5UK76_9EURY|nr:hypothetical protein [Halosegnis rubeus]KAB7514899.1 hypothetical protein DM867_07280 [Halosegnis rubeus]KAB7518208.1 hypothetical protein DMP03_02270 [Halosegnis rubeus]KAB7519212.1 hypothetical protein DP108_03635 [Halosegnis rubeus]
MTRPRLHTSSSQAVGLVAFVLFGVLAAVFLTADFADAATFSGNADSVIEGIGYAMLNLDAGPFAETTDGFLITFELLGMALLAALVGAVMLGTRDDDGGDS